MSTSGEEQATSSGGTVTANQGTAGADAWPVTIDNASLAVTQDSSWTVTGTVDIAAGQSIAATQSGAWTVDIAAGQTVAATQSGTWTVDQGGTWTVNIASGQSVDAVQSGTWTVDIAAGQTIGAVPQAPVSAQGATPYHLISAASTNATSVKAAAGVLQMVFAINQASAMRWLKIFDKASAPTLGTDTPVLNFPIPASPGGANFGAGFALPLPPNGIKLSNGLAFAITGGQADSDNTAISAGDVVLNMAYS